MKDLEKTAAVNPTSVYIENDIMQQVKILAKKEDRSVSWLIRKAVKDYLERNLDN